MRRHYCTYFDHRYLPRGLAMIRSLRRFDADAQIWVLCLSQECLEIMTEVDEPGVQLLPLSVLEEADPGLAAPKGNRSLIEYYFTCTPALVRYVLGKVEHGETVTYVDGDLYFYSDPSPLFAALDGDSVSIVPHRFAERNDALNVYGIYNVGWLSFRSDDRGHAVAEWWRDRCIEWCYDELDGDRFADQKYLDRFPRFEGVHIIDHPGANLAPWNLERHEIGLGEPITVDGLPLIFFHFHGLKRNSSSLYSVSLRKYRTRMSALVRRKLYRPYLKNVLACTKEVDALGIKSAAILNRGPMPTSTLGQIISFVRRVSDLVASFLTMDILVVIRGRVF